jgi:methionine-rich copper-binding protein CopC
MTHWRATGIVVASLALAVGTAARAQPRLERSEPAKNVTVSGVDHVTLRFSEPLDPKLSDGRIEFTAGPAQTGASFGGRPTLKTTTTGVDPQDTNSLRLTFASPLTPGLYTVRWRAGSSGGAVGRGQYSFYVK